MERRQVVGLSVGPLTAAGLGMGAWSFAPTAEAYVDVLRYGSVGCVALSFGVWIALLLTAGPARTPDQRRYISLGDAGAWLYPRTTQTVRDLITRNVPGLYKTADEGAEAYVKGALSKGVVDLYARRGAGLPMERVSSREMEFHVFEELFGSDRPKLFDLSIRRRDLRNLLEHYRECGDSALI